MKILLIEDNEDDKLILENTLLSRASDSSALASLQIEWAETFAQGEKMIKEAIYDIVLLDLSLPDSFGTSSIQKLQALKQDFAIIVFTGNLQEEIGIESVRAGADDFLVKGEYSRGILIRAMLHAVERRKNKIELARAQSELMESKLAAEEANDAKTVFLAMMSHEFRTPLQNILGFVSLLDETQLDEEQKEYVNIALNNVNKLDVLIEDIVDYSKVEKGTLKIINKPFDPEQIVRETVSMVERKMTKTGPEIAIEIDDHLPQILVGDSGRLMQILNNLLTNARKYTPSSGRIALSISTEHEERGIRFHCQVKDTGKGIHTKALTHIFAPFKQANPESDQALGGTGLGLAICKRLSHLMDGNICIESIEGSGTTVSFHLLFQELESTPLEQPAASEALTIPSDNQAPCLRILVAEDNPEGGIILCKQLEKLGHQCDLVQNGVQAIERLKSVEFDLILMDSRMPEMNGYEASKNIRDGAAGFEVAGIPIINISANTSQTDLARGRECGMNDFLTKPIHIKDLKEKIESLSKSISA